MSTLVRVSHVVIHTAATPGESKDISAAAIRAYHVNERKFTDIGYHWVVRFDGTIEPGRPETVIGAHVEGFNSQSIGVCFSGNGDLSDLTAAQKVAGARLVAEILKRHGLVDEFRANPTRVIGHREINNLKDAGVVGTEDAPRTMKTCPGRKVSCAAFRRLVLAEVAKVKPK